MKSTERHKLKENEFAHTVARAREVIDTRGRDMAMVAVAVVAALALAFGYMAWRHSRDARANTMLAAALAVAEAPVVGTGGTCPGKPDAGPAAGHLPDRTGAARSGVAEVDAGGRRVPNTDAGIAARYRAAGTLASLGRFAEAAAALQGSRRQGGQPDLRAHGQAGSGAGRRWPRPSTTTQSRSTSS